MPLYLYQCVDSQESFDRQLDHPHDRAEQAKPALDPMAVKVVADGIPFGEYTYVLVFEAPDDTTAAAVVIGVSATREVSSWKWTRLLSPEEWIEAMRKARVSPFMLLHPGGYPPDVPESERAAMPAQP